MLFKVPLKMLPFDNKNELQLVVRMPESTSLENTYSVVLELESSMVIQPMPMIFTDQTMASTHRGESA